MNKTSVGIREDGSNPPDVSQSQFPAKLMAHQRRPWRGDLSDRAILSVMDCNRTRHGLTVEAVQLHAQRFGLRCPVEVVELRLQQLAGQGHARRDASIEPAVWRITGSGIEWLDEQEQAEGGVR